MHDGNLSPEEMRWAIEHALAVHSLGEKERERLATATSLESLRELLLECGIPAADVDVSLVTLPVALEARHRRRRRLGRIALVFGAVIGVTAVAWWVASWISHRPPPPPRAFISLEHQSLNLPTRHTWSGGSSLTGGAERAVAGVFGKAGIEVVSTLEPRVIAQLYGGDRTEPSLGEVADATEATVAVLGSVACVNQGNILNTAMLSLRATVVLRLVEIAGARVVGEAKAGAAAGHIDPRTGCDRAIDKASGEALPELRRLLGKIGLVGAGKKPGGSAH